MILFIQRYVELLGGLLHFNPFQDSSCLFTFRSIKTSFSQQGIWLLFLTWESFSVLNSVNGNQIRIEIQQIASPSGLASLLTSTDIKLTDKDNLNRPKLLQWMSEVSKTSVSVSFCLNYSEIAFNGDNSWLPSHHWWFYHEKNSKICWYVVWQIEFIVKEQWWHSFFDCFIWHL